MCLPSSEVQPAPPWELVLVIIVRDWTCQRAATSGRPYHWMDNRVMVGDEHR